MAKICEHCVVKLLHKIHSWSTVCIRDGSTNAGNMLPVPADVFLFRNDKPNALNKTELLREHLFLQYGGILLTVPT